MISVIIPAYNAAETLGDCLAALKTQSIDRTQYRVIVVDDGSTDQTAEVALRFGVRLIQQPHAGPAAARNLGAQAAQGELLLFTDGDCVPAPDWVERMAEPFADPELVGVKGVYRTQQREGVARLVQLEYERKYVRMAHRMAREGRIDFIDTYSAAYRRDVFLANAGFDAAFSTASVEDQEFSFRLARKGYKLAFAPQAAVYHQHDNSLGEYWRRKYRIGYWKALLLRWHPERAARDSHTPQVLKAQIGLVGLLLASAPLVALVPWMRWVLLCLFSLFAASAVPFHLWVASRDPVLSPLVLPLLLVRALALGSGLVSGFLRFARRPDHRHGPIGGARWAIKRTVDIVLSVIGLIFGAPLLASLALAIRLDSPGPVFFVQQRIGKDGRPFRMIKLRTMIDGAEKMLAELIDLEALHQPAFKIRNDPRVTRVGCFLRRMSLDELPQLWNVLKGEMSLVGPRPEEARVVRLYSDWHRQRLAVKPGMTGPMQVNGRADLALDERIRLELDYIEHYSLWRDLCILARTVIAVVSGQGAY